jgi:hypothetical protein
MRVDYKKNRSAPGGPIINILWTKNRTISCGFGETNSEDTKWQRGCQFFTI